MLKPDVEDLLGVDLQFLEISAKILQFIDPSLERTSLVDILGADLRKRAGTAWTFVVILRWLGVSCAEVRSAACHHVGDIRQSMLKECDFQAEARNLSEFSNYLDRNGLRQIATAPFAYPDLVSKR